MLEIVFPRGAPAFHKLVMGCVFNINAVPKTALQAGTILVAMASEKNIWRLKF